jgi:hypothetical protein
MELIMKCRNRLSFSCRHLFATCLLFTSVLLPLQSWAADTDGDGVDDSIDAFPNNAEATTDTDHDGQPDVLNNLLFSESFDGAAASGWTGIYTSLPLGGGWTLNGTTAHSGSGSLAGYASSGVRKTVYRTVTIPAQGGYISYWHLKDLGCSSSVNCGFNAYTNSLMTSYTWVKSTYSLNSGVQTLTWMVQCGGSFGSYRCGFLDDIEVRSNSSLVEDTDDDNDSVADTSDVFPLDAAESLDTDLDGIGNNADTDDDNDGLPDTVDPAPLDANSSWPLNGNYKGGQVKESQFRQ